MRRLLIFSLSVLLFIFSVQTSHAQELLTIIPTQVATPTAMQPAYALPYPGILPDNPLYVLKAVRDRVVDFFVSDPLKKSNLHLLDANKRLNAAIFLLQGKNGKDQLAESTIAKGENYFEQAITDIKVAKQRGYYTKGALADMGNAAAKHESALKLIQKTIANPNKAGIQKSIDRVDQFEITITALMAKK